MVNRTKVFNFNECWFKRKVKRKRVSKVNLCTKSRPNEGLQEGRRGKKHEQRKEVRKLESRKREKNLTSDRFFGMFFRST